MVERILDDLIKSGLARNQYDWSPTVSPFFAQLLLRNEYNARSISALSPRQYAEELASGLKYIYGDGVQIIPAGGALVEETED
jgi:hypothetical protein